MTKQSQTLTFKEAATEWFLSFIAPGAQQKARDLIDEPFLVLTVKNSFNGGIDAFIQTWNCQPPLCKKEKE